MKSVGFPGDLLSRTNYKKMSPCWAHGPRDPQKQWVTHHRLKVNSQHLLSRVLLQSTFTSSISPRAWSLQWCSWKRQTRHTDRISKTLKSIGEKRQGRAASGCSLLTLFKMQGLEIENVRPGAGETPQNQAQVSLHRSEHQELECTVDLHMTTLALIHSSSGTYDVLEGECSSVIED